MVYVLKRESTVMYKKTVLFLAFLFTCSDQAISSELIADNDYIQKNTAFVPRTVTEQIMYSTIRIQTDKAVSSSFRFDFSIGELGKVPCLITARHAVEGASVGRLIFHEVDILDDKPVPSGKSFNLDLLDLKNECIVFHSNSNVDLCAIPLLPLLKKMDKKPYMIALDQSILPSIQDIKNLSVVEDIIMVGYPTGLYDTVNNFPIFRKGITSSHPIIDFDGKPEFMIDAACFPGSSGSPVFFYSNGIHSFGTNLVINGQPRIFLLGMLYNNAELKLNEKTTALNLGYVIKENQLGDIKLTLEKIVAEKIKI